MDLDQAAAEYRTISRTLRRAMRTNADPASFDTMQAERTAIANRLNAAGHHALLVDLSDEDILIGSIGERDSGLDRATLAGIRDRIVARLELAGGTQRGFHAEIYTGPHHTPGGGTSATVRQVTVISTGGRTLDQEFRLSAPTADAPAVRITNRGNGYLAAIPAAPVPAGYVGYMASGALVYSSDDRWARLVGNAVVHLHDHTETGAQYDALSD